MTEAEFAGLTWYQRKHAQRIAKALAIEQAKKKDKLSKEAFLVELEARMVAGGFWSRA